MVRGRMRAAAAATVVDFSGIRCDRLGIEVGKQKANELRSADALLGETSNWISQRHCSWVDFNSPLDSKSVQPNRRTIPDWPRLLLVFLSFCLFWGLLLF